MTVLVTRTINGRRSFLQYMYVGDHILESICKRGSYYTEFGLVLTVLTCWNDVNSMRVNGWESPFDAFFCVALSPIS